MLAALGSSLCAGAQRCSSRTLRTLVLAQDNELPMQPVTPVGARPCSLHTGLQITAGRCLATAWGAQGAGARAMSVVAVRMRNRGCAGKSCAVELHSWCRQSGGLINLKL